MIKCGWQNRIFMSPTFWQIPIKCFKLEQFQKLILNQSGNVVSKCCEDFEISQILTFSLISLRSNIQPSAGGDLNMGDLTLHYTGWQYADGSNSSYQNMFIITLGPNVFFPGDNDIIWQWHVQSIVSNAGDIASAN